MTVLERLKAAGYDPVKAITHHLTAGTGEMECSCCIRPVGSC